MDFSKSKQEVKNTQLQFILAEVNVGLKCAAIARGERRTKEQRLRRARSAYDSGLRFLNRVDLTERESEQVLCRLQALKGYLEVLGETFPT